jgi:hypothetical protein
MTNFRMAVIGFAAAAALAGSQALAAGSDMPLAPGKPAGVQDAQRHHGPSLLLIGGVTAALVAGVIIATTTSSSAACSATACPTSVSTSTTS